MSSVEESSLSCCLCSSPSPTFTRLSRWKDHMTRVHELMPEEVKELWKLEEERKHLEKQESKSDLRSELKIAATNGEDESHPVKRFKPAIAPLEDSDLDEEKEAEKKDMYEMIEVKSNTSRSDSASKNNNSSNILKLKLPKPPAAIVGSISNSNKIIKNNMRDEDDSDSWPRPVQNKQAASKAASSSSGASVAPVSAFSHVPHMWTPQEETGLLRELGTEGVIKIANCAKYENLYQTSATAIRTKLIALRKAFATAEAARNPSLKKSVSSSVPLKQVDDDEEMSDEGEKDIIKGDNRHHWTPAAEKMLFAELGMKGDITQRICEALVEKYGVGWSAIRSKITKLRYAAKVQFLHTKKVLEQTDPNSAVNNSSLDSGSVVGSFGANMGSRLPRGGVCHLCAAVDPHTLIQCNGGTNIPIGDDSLIDRKKLCRKRYCYECCSQQFNLSGPNLMNAVKESSEGKWCCFACQGMCACIGCALKQHKTSNPMGGKIVLPEDDKEVGKFFQNIAGSNATANVRRSTNGYAHAALLSATNQLPPTELIYLSAGEESHRVVAATEHHVLLPVLCSPNTLAVSVQLPFQSEMDDLLADDLKQLNNFGVHFPLVGCSFSIPPGSKYSLSNLSVGGEINGLSLIPNDQPSETEMKTSILAKSGLHVLLHLWIQNIDEKPLDINNVKSSDESKVSASSADVILIDNSNPLALSSTPPRTSDTRNSSPSSIIKIPLSSIDKGKKASSMETNYSVVPFELTNPLEPPASIRIRVAKRKRD